MVLTPEWRTFLQSGAVKSDWWPRFIQVLDAKRTLDSKITHETRNGKSTRQNDVVFFYKSMHMHANPNGQNNVLTSPSLFHMPVWPLTQRKNSTWCEWNKQDSKMWHTAGWPLCHHYWTPKHAQGHIVYAGEIRAKASNWPAIIKIAFQVSCCSTA